MGLRLLLRTNLIRLWRLCAWALLAIHQISTRFVSAPTISFSDYSPSLSLTTPLSTFPSFGLGLGLSVAAGIAGLQFGSAPPKIGRSILLSIGQP